jgi:hypothetical protein
MMKEGEEVGTSTREEGVGEVRVGWEQRVQAGGWRHGGACGAAVGWDGTRVALRARGGRLGREVAV